MTLMGARPVTSPPQKIRKALGSPSASRAGCRSTELPGLRQEDVARLEQHAEPSIAPPPRTTSRVLGIHPDDTVLAVPGIRGVVGPDAIVGGDGSARRQTQRRRQVANQQGHAMGRSLWGSSVRIPEPCSARPPHRSGSAACATGRGPARPESKAGDGAVDGPLLIAFSVAGPPGSSGPTKATR